MGYPEAKTGQTTQQSSYLKLYFNQQMIMIGLTQIHMILPILALQKIPTNDAALEGSFNYHGVPVLVYHLAELIHAPPVPYNLNSLLLIGAVAQGLAGFIVSDQLDLVDIADDKITLPQLYHDMPYVTGIVENETWSGWVLDLNQLITFHYHSAGIPHE